MEAIKLDNTELKEIIKEKYGDLYVEYEKAGLRDELFRHIRVCDQLGVNDLDVVFDILRARNDSTSGFAAYYRLLTGWVVPQHVIGWMDLYYQAKRERRPLLIEAFRGSSKSTVASIFLSFRIGQEPVKSNFVVCSNDDDADQMTLLAADFIESTAFSWVFPDIVPDKDRKWSVSSGFEVRDMTWDYKKWRKERNLSGRLPTLKGCGQGSKTIPGPHPNGVLLVDDICDEDNTTSEKELAKVIARYQGIIIPMLEPETVHIISGTPWTVSDVIAVCRNNDEYIKAYTPVYIGNPDDKIPTWPEKWPEEEIEKRRRFVNNEVEFARMYHLDLERIKGRVLKRKWLHYWPAKEIIMDWPVYFGIDFTSTEDPMNVNVDYFCLSVLRVIPGNRGGILEDGFRKRISDSEAEDIIIEWAAMYPSLQKIAIEAILVGHKFYTEMLRSKRLIAAGLRVVPVKFNSKKGYRYEKIMAPLFRTRRIYLSDEPTSYVKHFESEWLSWQGDKLAMLGHDDTLDATFAAIKAAEAFVSEMRKPKVGQRPRDNGRNPIARGFGRKN